MESCEKTRSHVSSCVKILTPFFRSLKRLSTYTVLSDQTPKDRAPLSHRDNQLLVAFWTCLQLERYPSF